MICQNTNLLFKTLHLYKLFPSFTVSFFICWLKIKILGGFINIYTYIYIYRERETEREREIALKSLAVFIITLSSLPV